MEKAKTLTSFRKEKRKEFEVYEKELEEVNKELGEKYQEIRQEVLGFISSDFVPHKIAHRLVEEQIPQLEALALIHRAMYKLNDIIIPITIEKLPDVNKVYGDVKIMVSSLKQELLVDETLHRLTNSNAEREREADYILLNVNNKFKRIERTYNTIKELIKFLNKQSDYLMRLESSIRLKQKMLDSSAITEAMASGQAVLQMEI